jgi:hypothetical protein
LRARRPRPARPPRRGWRPRSFRYRPRMPPPPCAPATTTPPSCCSSGRRGRIPRGAASHRTLVRTLAEVGRYADAEEERRSSRPRARAPPDAQHARRSPWPRAAAKWRRRPPSRRRSRAAPRTRWPRR